VAQKNHWKIKSRRHVIRGAAVLAAGIAAPSILRNRTAFAAFPDRAVKIVVANSPGDVGVQSHYGRGRCFQLTEEIASASFQGRNLVLYGGTGNARFESCDQPTNLAFGLFQIAVARSRRTSCSDACRFTSL
jgi:hypothetical protein